MDSFIKEGAEVIRVQNLANGTVRLVIDLYDTPNNAANIGIAYALREVPTTIILAPTEKLQEESE